MMRLLRITGVALGLALLFGLSQQVSAVRGNEAVPGISWALGVISLLFLVRAIVTERTQGPQANLQKDVLWGLAAGGILSILARW